jgi:predicted transporter
MMMLIHLVMLGFLVGAGLCTAHFGMRRWAEARDVTCPWGRAAQASSRTLRIGAMGLGAYVLASVGWAAIPAALTGFFLTRPALKPALARATSTPATTSPHAHDS